MKKPQIKSQLLEQAGLGDFDMYRVPGVIVTERGTILAYCDARRGEGKQAAQSLFLYRSEDGGETWQPRQKLAASRPGERLLNLTLISAPGCIHGFYVSDYHNCLHIRSLDDGLTWSQPENITDAFGKFSSEFPYNVFSIGPSHGLCLKNGRLLLPAWLSSGGSTHKPSVFALIYSDDAGKTWNAGGLIKGSEQLLNPNEGALAELDDGRILLSVRHDSFPRARTLFESLDEGNTFQFLGFRMDLPDPICAAGMTNRDGVLYFSNCANADEGCKALKEKGLIQYDWKDDARKNLTVRMSTDGGKSWSHSGRIAEKGGYSDLAVLPDGERIICIYEGDWDTSCIYPQKIHVVCFTRTWLEQSDIVGN